jgi:hypothetical protein
VGRADEEPSDNADKEQREELEDDSHILEPGHLTDPDQVDDGGHPESHQGDAPVLHAGRMVEAEQRVDVEHP